jgi:hypothetical protein
LTVVVVVELPNANIGPELVAAVTTGAASIFFSAPNNIGATDCVAVFNAENDGTAAAEVPGVDPNNEKAGAPEVGTFGTCK